MTGQFFRDLVTDGKSLAWIDGKAVRACSIADCTGTLSTVVQDATAVHLALNPSGIYWTSAGSGGSDGKVLHVAAGGLAVTQVATGQLAPDGIALDGTFVYWTTHGCEGCAAGECAILRARTP